MDAVRDSLIGIFALIWWIILLLNFFLALDYFLACFCFVFKILKEISSPRFPLKFLVAYLRFCYFYVLKRKFDLIFKKMVSMFSQRFCCKSFFIVSKVEKAILKQIFKLECSKNICQELSRKLPCCSFYSEELLWTST